MSPVSPMHARSYDIALARELNFRRKDPGERPEGVMHQDPADWSGPSQIEIIAHLLA